MAEAQRVSENCVILEENPEENNVRLRLKKPKTEKKVIWREDTVDNEHMNKKKSKCCCIYEKPRPFGESSSDTDDDECEHCRGHVEKRKKGQKVKPPDTSVTQVIPQEFSQAV